jgi:hypothetical protein
LQDLFLVFPIFSRLLSPVFQSSLPGADKPQPKRLLFTRSRGVRGDVFYYKLFYSATLRLRVQKNILPGNGRILRLGSQIFMSKKKISWMPEEKAPHIIIIFDVDSILF